MTLALVALMGLLGCAAAPPPVAPPPRPGDPLPRLGDEIVVGGQLFHTGTRVVLWTDPKGYDAYRAHNWFKPDTVLPAKPVPGCETPSRLSLRRELVPEARALTVGDSVTAPSLEALRRQITQFVIHYDVAYTSAACFYVLHDARGLSVHFMLDVDGTVYQTCDLRERARHAGPANDRSVGIEIAHPGPLTGQEKLRAQYKKDPEGTWLDMPAWVRRGHLGEAKVRPARPDAVRGTIHGKTYEQFDFTEAQYRALAHLSAAVSRALPRVKLDAPRTAAGAVRTDALSEAELAAFEGLIGHYHVTTSKVDPGPAFDWERVLREARGLLAEPRP